MIVHVLGRFPPPLDGQTLATRRMAELIAAAHQVRHINTEPPATEFVENEVSLRWARVRHYVGLTSKIRIRLAEAPTAPVLWASISPAVLGHYRDLLSIAPSFGPRHPVAGVIHRSGYDALFRSPATYPTAKRLVKRLSAFVFLNDALSLDCARWIPHRKRRVIPNTIDEALIFSAEEIDQKRQWQRGRSPIRVLFLSNMIPFKGYLDVLSAIAVVRARGVPVEADFVGRWGSDGDRRSFQETRDRDHLSDIVRYHGGVDDRAKVKEFYRSADVFALPSYHPTEAQPVALIEAMNAGLPIVTTKHGGIPSMFATDSALFVAPKNAVDIAEAIERVVHRDVWLRYSEESRANYERLFSPEVVTMKWESLLEHLIR